VGLGDRNALAENSNVFRAVGQMAPRVVRVSENQPLPPEIQALLYRDGMLEIFPEVVASRFLAMSLRGGRPVVRTTNFVGVLPLNARLTLEVEPKVPVASVASMLAHSNEDVILFGGKNSHEFDSSDVVARQLLELLASEFVRSVEQILAVGLAKQYNRIESLSESARGAIRFSATVRARARNQPLLIGSRRFERTARTDVNSALLATTVFVARALRSASSSRTALRIIADCNRLSRHFPQPEPLTLPSAVRRSIRSLRLHQVRPDYARSLRLADVLLSGAGVEVSPLPGGIQSQCFMLGLDLIFEDYVRSILRAGLTDFHVRAAKKFPPHGARRLLLTKGTAKAETDPDVVVLGLDEQPILVLDAKYKNPQRGLDRADLNQVIAYGAAYAVSSVALVVPSTSPAAEVSFLGEAGGLRVHCVSVDLGSADRTNAEARLVGQVRSLL
jgi:5-methylcytosine-specific restriction enzyme subunit McrC